MIFWVSDGLIAFIIFLILGAFIDVLQLLISRKFKTLIVMVLFYLILISIYYTILDLGIFR